MGRLKGRRGRKSKYLKSLRNNPYWETVKRKVKIRDGFECVICSAKAPLEIHHISYKVYGRTIRGKELEYLNWLVTLCETCHTAQHFEPKTPFNPRSPNKLTVSQYKNARKK